MSFAYLMFFGVGAYGVSLPRYAVDTNWSALVIGLIAAAALSLALALATWPFLALDAVDLLLHGNVGGHLASAASPTVAVAVAGFCEAPVGRQAPQGCDRGRRGLAPGIERYLRPTPARSHLGHRDNSASSP